MGESEMRETEKKQMELLNWALSDGFAVRRSNEVVRDTKEKFRGVDEQLKRFAELTIGSLLIANDLLAAYHKTGSVLVASQCLAGGKQFLSHAWAFQLQVANIQIQRKTPFRYSIQDEEYEQALEEQ